MPIHKLTNGLTVAAHPMPQMESVSIGLWIRAGVRYEERRNNGITHLLEHLLFKGTEHRDMKTMKEEVEGRGGSFNGFTAEEFTCYLVKLLAKDAALGVDILSDMVLAPKLAADEVAKEKSVIVEEINMYKDMPSHYVHEILTEMLWPDQALGMPLAGTAESVHALDRAAVSAYKETHYNPNNMLLIAAGNITDTALAKLAEKYIAKASPGKLQSFAKAAGCGPGKQVRVHYKETEQTHVAMGLHAIDRFHPDRYALAVMNIVLGANMSSRLFHIVRDEMALCYEIASSARLYDDAGAFVISAGVDTAKLVKAVDVILREVGRMRREAISPDELRRAKEYYKGQLLFALEDTMSYMLWLGEKIVTGEKEFDARRIIDRIEKVTADDIMKVARTIFRDDNLALAVIGPVKEEAALKEAAHFT